MAIKYHRALNGGRGGTGWPSSITEHSMGEGEVQDGHQVSLSTYWGKGRYRMAIKYHSALTGGRVGTGWPSSITEHLLREG